MSEEPITHLNPRIPLTTREPKPGETNGVQFHFISKEEFQGLIDAGALREHGEYQDNFYGMLRPRASSYITRVNSMVKRNSPAKSHLQTVLLEKDSEGSLGIDLAGGFQDKSLIYIDRVNGNCTQVTYTSRPLRKGDCIVAVDGVSVAGVGYDEAIQLIEDVDEDIVEFLVYAIEGPLTGATASVLRFLEDDENDDDDLRAVKADVRKDVYASIVPYTTREPRDGEVDGEKYVFVSEDEFKTLIDEDHFLEYGQAPNGAYYGTPHLKPQKFRAKADKKISRSAFNRSSTYVKGTRKKVSDVQCIVVENPGNFGSLGIEIVGTEHGNFITDVVDGSPADKVGLHRGHQIVSVDGADVEHADRSVIRGVLDRPTKKIVVGVRHNADFPSAMKQQVAAAKQKNVHSIVLARNDAGQWGIGMEGGAEFGELIAFGKLSDVNYLTDHYTLALGDCLLAVEGTSVAGSSVYAAIDLIKQAGETVELTILSVAGSSYSNKLNDFFDDLSSDDSAIKAAKNDIRKHMYKATVPYTTRAKRDGEEDGVVYNFVSREEFLDLQADGFFVEWGESNGTYYGTPYPDEEVTDSAAGPSGARHALKAQESRLQTVVLEQGEDGSWGMAFAGGVSTGELPHIASIDDTCKMVQFSDAAPTVNDIVLAVNGISVAGHDSAYATEMLETQEGTAEISFIPTTSSKKATFDQMMSLVHKDDELDEQLKEIVADVRKDVYQSNIPYTTRDPRPGEVRGRDYNFVTLEEFKQMHDDGKFVEVGENNGVFYGTAINQGKVSANHKPRQSLARHRSTTRQSRTNRPRIYTLENNGEELGLELGTAANSDDVIIAAVKENSAASAAGLRENMRIAKIGAVPMAGLSVDNVQVALENAYGTGEPVPLVTTYVPSAYVKTARVPTYFSPAGKFVGGVNRIHLWSTPRSLSTAMLRAFGQRPDTNVIDEPFYASMLAKNPQMKFPDTNDVLEHQSSDPIEVLYKIGTTADKPVLFCKHVSSEYPFDVTDDWLEGAFHVLMYSDPTTIVTKFGNIAECTFKDAALADTLSIMTKLKAKNIPFMVVSSADFKANPGGVLRGICEQAGIEFTKKMLSWPQGPMPYDGVWGKTWYTTINKTTGFIPRATSSGNVGMISSTQRAVIKDCYPFFIALEHNKTTFVDPDDVAEDPAKVTSGENDDIFVWVGTSLVPRSFAKISVFDAAVQGGDAVWEGLRVYDGKVFNLDAHLASLLDSAQAMDFADVPSDDYIKDAVLAVLAANSMVDGIYVRILLTRGENSIATQNPRYNKDGCTLVVIAEHRESRPEATFSLVTGFNREVPTQCIDTNINHTNLIAKILPQLQANAAGADEALLLNVDGYVSQTTESNVFIIKKGVLQTPEEDLCYAGAIRSLVIAIAKDHGLTVEEKKLPVSSLYTADEIFVASALGEITPVVSIDGRSVGSGAVGDFTMLMALKYNEFITTNSTPINAPTDEVEEAEEVGVSNV